MAGQLLISRFLKERTKLNRVLTAILLSLILPPGLRNVSAQKDSSLAPCQVGRNAPGVGFWTWPGAAHVKVYIRTADFLPEQIQYLLTPLQNWNSVSKLTESGVKFEYQGSTTEELTCENCLTIMRAPVFDKTKRHATETKAYSVHRDQIITYAAIFIDPLLTNTKSLTNAVSHELGHNLGLLDCYTCKQKSTLMNQFKALNVPNDLEAPTSCDIAQVKEAYRELKVRIRPSPRVMGADEGEEPIDDDTPIVVPKP